jgi:hypothetical protein
MLTVSCRELRVARSLITGRRTWGPGPLVLPLLLPTFRLDFLPEESVNDILTGDTDTSSQEVRGR